MPTTVRSDRVSAERALYECMFLIRQVEETLLALYSEGKLTGTTHTSIGQEACAAGVIGCLDPERDFVFSNHRCHGHYIAHGGDLAAFFAELMGRAGGLCGGVGGSQHLCGRNFYTNGIQGGIVPVAVGMALAEKWKGSGGIGAVFLGDGTFGEGAAYEAMNLASLWRAPLLFAVEDNGYAQSTPSGLAHAGELAARPRAFNIDTVDLPVEDPLVVRHVAESLVAAIRADSRPRCLVLRTYRLAPHSKGEDYRPPEEIEAHRQRDPLARLRLRLPEGVAAEIEADVRRRVSEAVAAAEAEPYGTLADLQRRLGR